MMNRGTLPALLALALVLSPSPALRAQRTTSAISGTVVDATGGMIAQLNSRRPPQAAGPHASLTARSAP